MFLLTSAAHLYGYVRSYRYVYDPEWRDSQSVIPRDQLKKREIQGLERVTAIAQQIIGEDRFVSVDAGRNEKNWCATYGCSSNAKILFNTSFLRSLSDCSELKTIYRETWETAVKDLPDDPEELKIAIDEMDQGDVAVLMGLYEELCLSLTDDELYFVLRHEIVGHHQSHDNEALLRIKFIATVASLVFYKIIESSTLYTNVLASLFTFYIPSFCIGKLTFSQELCADAMGVAGDERALRGAKLFFKTLLINELALKRYYELTGNVGNVRDWMTRRIREKFSLYHPSAEIRYQQVMQLLQKKD
ncbi:MAG: M48 family metalloprotease [Waddliaceae bacterium]